MTNTESAGRSTSHGALGSLSLLAGIVLLALRGIEMTQTLPGMPRFWHQHDALWIGIALFSMAFGAWLLGSLSSEQKVGSWRPKRAGRRFQKVILYTRAGCHLCEEARDVLDQHRRWLPELVEIDIEQDARLVEKFGTCVPVVSLDGKVRFRSKISLLLLRRLIENSPVTS